MKRYAIITCGGIGKRLGTALPKQFAELAGKPVLYHCLEVFKQADADIKLIVSLPEHYIAFWEDLIKHFPPIKHHIVHGGLHRFDSVKNALEIVPDNVLVAVHDGVRPLVSTATIRQAFNLAKQAQGAVPVCPLRYSLRKTFEDGTSAAVEREAYVQVNTPQCFHSTLLKQAYQTYYKPEFTDDASVFEAAGHSVQLFEDEAKNIKITYPEDLIIAELLLQ